MMQAIRVIMIQIKAWKSAVRFERSTEICLEIFQVIEIPAAESHALTVSRSKRRISGSRLGWPDENVTQAE